MGEFDLVVLPEVVCLLSDHDACVLLGRACDALKPQGEVLVLEAMAEPTSRALEHAIADLEIRIATQQGRLRTPAELESLLMGAGLEKSQWGPLPASIHGIGMMIAPRSAGPP
jgi:hypothetical protein